MKLLNVSLFIIASVAIAGAEDQTKGPDLGNAPAKTVRVKATASSTSQAGETSPAAIGSTQIRDVARNVTIAAKDYRIFEVAADLSGAEKVGFSVTTLEDPTSRLTNVRFAFGWASPGDWYVVTDVVLGNTFSFFDHGGITVPAYGPLLKVLIFNDGTTPLRITQVAVNAVIR